MNSLRLNTTDATKPALKKADTIGLSKAEIVKIIKQ